MIITVQCKPNSKEQVIEKISETDFLVRLKSSPVDGKANQELIQILAKYFGVTKSEVSIKKGQTSKHKLIEIDQN